MKKQKLIAIVMTIALVAGMCGVLPTSAATDTGQHNTTFSNKTAIDVTVTGSVAFGDVGPTAAATQTDAVTVNVKSNQGWSMTAESIGADATDQVDGANDDPYFTSGANQIPVGRLEVTDTSSNWKTMVGTDAGVSVLSGSATSGANYLMDYRLTLQYGDVAADNYSTYIMYTGTTL